LETTKHATRSEDLEEAGILLAGAIGAVGVKAFITIITRGTNRTMGAPRLPDGWRPPPPQTRKPPERTLQRTPRSAPPPPPPDGMNKANAAAQAQTLKNCSAAGAAVCGACL
jgi:hypothetical protein